MFLTANPETCGWDVDPASVCSGWTGYTESVKETALRLASTWIWAATGRRFGACPVTVRPSQARYGPEVAYQAFPVTVGQDGLGFPGGPFLFGGRWFNSGCATACCGNSACAIVLRGPVAGVDSVWVDGDLVDPDAYRVDVTSGVWLLVRTDGACWPACQNMAADPGEPDTFEVTYRQGVELPAALADAVGMLACEYGKHLTGGACALPARMTRLSRQGVEVEVAPPDPVAGSTGIRMVDDILAALNPGKLRRPPQILSPDLPENCDRYTVFAGGS